MKDINLFLKEFNIKTNNKEIYEMAFTHSSFNSDANTHHHDYERLEFIGDSVLGFVVASLIYKYHPEMEEGDMTKAKSTLVQSKSLAKLARQFGFNEYIRAGHSLTIEEAKKNNNILEDIFEAVVGAMYEDQGIEFCINFLTKVFLDEVINYTQEDFKDYKSMLQEAMQAEYRSSVTYNTIDTMGPPHDRTFKVEVSFNGVVLGFGIGKSKKEAEQKAAQDALSKKAV